MKTSLLTRIFTLLCALTLLACAIPASAGMGGDFPWTKEEEPMLIEQILERDGFLEGIWYPWFDGGNVGHSLTGNDTMVRYYGTNWSTVAMDTVGADKIYYSIYNLKSMGYNLLGYGGSIYDEGVIHDAYGDVLGVKQEFLDNARRLLDMCREIGMPVMWTICFHSSSAPDYYGLDGYSIFAQKYANPEVTDHYVERFVRPVCEMLGEYKDVVALVAIADEPENEINDAEKGDHFGSIRSLYGVDRDQMVHFMSRINDVVKEVLPDVARTVASNDQDKTIYHGFDLDLGGHNEYHNQANIPDTETFKTDAPMLLTEYNVGGEAQMTDETYTRILIQFRENMMKYGYKGGVQWAWMTYGTRRGTAYYLLDSVQSPNTDFCETVFNLRRYMDDYRATYRGETVALDAPVLYANEGGGYVEWIPSRQATEMDILRSTDGGENWTYVLQNVNPDSYITKGKGRYKDTAVANSRYKIVVRDGKGNEVESEPNNVAGIANKYRKTTTRVQLEGAINIGRYSGQMGSYRLYSSSENHNRPASDEVNLIQNGSFENAAGGQWNNSNFLGSNVQVVTDPTAPEGEKSLFFNTSGNDTAQWHSFTVEGLQPNTDYVFAAWVKTDYLSEANAAKGSIGVIDPSNGRFMVDPSYRNRASRDNRQLAAPAPCGRWQLRAVAFNSKDLTQVDIALYGLSSTFWVDGIALYVNGDGIKYIGPNRSTDVSLNPLVEVDTCAPEDNLLINGDFEQGAVGWENGHGWRNGFLTVVESETGYGASLKYASDDAYGLHYVQWIDVEPNTDYVFSLDMKIMEQGLGKFVLMNDRMTLPENVVAFELDKESYGGEWLHFAFEVNPREFTRLGIGFCDLGGEALIDNVRFFKKSDAAAVKDLYLDGMEVTNNVAYGKTASVTVNAEGDGLKYAWYFKDKTHSKFYLTTSFTGKTYSTKMDATRDGRQVYCVVTDKYGTSRKTAVTTLTMKPTALKITTQPKTSTYVKDGATAKVTVKAQGDGLKYAWYFKNAGKTSYSKSSITTATYSVKMSSSASDRRLYCVITDAYGNKVQTQTVLIRRQVAIIKQPATVTYAKNGAKASVKITANGDGLKYAWYVKNANASKYSKSSVTSSTYSVTMSDSVKGRRVYCVVTDKYGKKVQSETYLLRMAATITTQPKTVTVKKNATAKVTVKAKGDGLKYTWYIKNEGAKKYSKSSVTKSTYSAKMTSKSKNRLVYCVVTDKYGNKVQSKTVRLKMK